MWHLSPVTNKPEKCTAKEGRCPYGSEHYETEEEAMQADEKRLEKKYGVITTVSPRRKGGFNLWDSRQKLNHYSVDDFELDQNAQYPPESDSWAYKPNGLWVGMDNSWVEWDTLEKGGSYETPMLPSGEIHELQLTDDADILHLSAVEELEKFHEKYNNGNYIDWQKVKQDFDGIFISDYNKFEGSGKSYANWYYTWDVSSGCIWNLGVVEQGESKSAASTISPQDDERIVWSSTSDEYQ